MHKNKLLHVHTGCNNAKTSPIVLLAFEFEYVILVLYDVNDTSDVMGKVIGTAFCIPIQVLCQNL